MEACLSLCAQLPSVVRAYPAELKALAAMLRLRLFEAISLMPPATLEKSYTQLLRLLVSATVTIDDELSVLSCVSSSARARAYLPLSTFIRGAAQ